MLNPITAIYENGVLHPLGDLNLREHSQVKLQILEVIPSALEADEARRVEEALIAAGLVKPRTPISNLPHISAQRREELARLYAVGGPLSELIIAEREER
jgi:predicted DNA-binding antitoxin AbrB/MazE fold protein